MASIEMRIMRFIRSLLSGWGQGPAQGHSVRECQEPGSAADGVDSPGGIDVLKCGSREPAEREPPAMSITMIGLDTAKSVFQLHAVDDAGQVVTRRKLQRNELIAFFQKQEPCMVAMEACGAGHHWARVLTGLGCDVKLIAPEVVRPFVKKGKKNDAADAAGICKAASRPGVRFVPIKGVEQQGILALHSARSLLVKQQTRPCCRDQGCGRGDPRPACVQATRTEFGRPKSSMQFRAWTATFTSVARRGSVRERSPSPITCLNLPMVASARARMV